MTVTTTTRIGLTRWSAPADPFSRAQMDASHAALEAKVMLFAQDTLANRPAPGVTGRAFTVTDAAAGAASVFYDTGTAWVEWRPNLSAYATQQALTDGLAGKANTVHTHTKSQITDFAHSHAIGDLPVAASGQSSTTLLVRADDARLSDARTPVAHSHAIGDLPVAASGASSATQLVRADDLRLSNARTPTAHSHAIGDLPVAASGASSSTQLVRADDSRLADARTPLAHSHAIGDLPVATSGTSSATQLVRADDSRLSNARTPLAHSHAIGDLPVAASGVSDSTLLVRSNDSRLSDARTPVTHTHPTSDVVGLDLRAEPVVFTYVGPLAATTGSVRFPVTGGTFTIISVAVTLGATSTSGPTISDLNKNGTSMYTTQGNRPTVGTGIGGVVTATLPDTRTVTTGDWLSVDLDATASGAEDFTMVVRMVRTGS